MPLWQWLLIAVIALIFVIVGSFAVWIRRTGITAGTVASELKAFGGDMVRLPGRLRRLAADRRVPRRARWMLIGLAVYVASPIDLIPDFLPGIGHLDEVILVPLVLARIRRMIPPDVWAEHFPPREVN
jgi:hypothetical protein